MFSRYGLRPRVLFVRWQELCSSPVAMLFGRVLPCFALLFTALGDFGTSKGVITPAPFGYPNFPAPLKPWYGEGQVSKMQGIRWSHVKNASNSKVGARKGCEMLGFREAPQ